MKSSKPYFLRAIHEWVSDNDMKPYMHVHCGHIGVIVPPEQIEADETITLNLSHTAIRDFVIDSTAITFKTRFSGVEWDIYVPIEAVMGLYAKENGQGMAFMIEAPMPNQPATPTKVEAPRPPKGKPTLKVVK